MNTAAQERLKRVPVAIQAPIWILALGLGCYWMFTGTGLFDLVSELQASVMDGDYYPKLSVAVCLLVPLLLAAAIVHGIACFYPPKDEIS